MLLNLFTLALTAGLCTIIALCAASGAVPIIGALVCVTGLVGCEFLRWTVLHRAN